MMNWSEYEKEEIKNERFHMRRILIAVLLGGFIAAGLLAFAKKASADPRFAADGDNGAVITLFDDPCELKEQITNLPYKATWTESGKQFDGCWAPVQQLGVVQMWFTDKTAFPVPLRVLKPVVGA
jgi:hypothetical protein